MGMSSDPLRQLARDREGRVNITISLPWLHALPLQALLEVVQTVSETCEDPVAYLAALRDWQAPTGGGS